MKEQKEIPKNRILQVHLDRELHRRLRILISRREISARQLITSLIQEELKRDRDGLSRHG